MKLEMKPLFVLALVLFSLVSFAQDYRLPNEKVLFEFKTTKGKTLVVALDSNEKYLVYRYGTVSQIELQFPEELSNSWSSFQYSWYRRGGGIQNEGMDVDYLYFDRNNFRYVVFQEYYASDEETTYGIKIINLKTGTETIIMADPTTVRGTLGACRDLKSIKKGEELF